ncbi:fatty acid-binding protein-like [Oratosquilla oratoria]|uniref:fatty acid-binding protein-like n=1 Tax=Oratosquilla oratoria TaxID=337810 RepID=UPI003F76A1A5
MFSTPFLPLPPAPLLRPGAALRELPIHKCCLSVRSLHSVHTAFSSSSADTNITANMSVTGKYTLDSSENFDEFMKALGVGMVMRKLGNTSKPTVELTEKDGEYHLKTSTTLKNSEISFKLNEEFDETTFDGRECKTTFTLEGNKLTQTQKTDKGKDVIYIREFSEDQMVMECTCDGVTSKRVYKRV